MRGLLPFLDLFGLGVLCLLCVLWFTMVDFGLVVCGSWWFFVSFMLLFWVFLGSWFRLFCVFCCVCCFLLVGFAFLELVAAGCGSHFDNLVRCGCWLISGFVGVIACLVTCV